MSIISKQRVSERCTISLGEVVVEVVEEESTDLLGIQKMRMITLWDLITLREVDLILELEMSTTWRVTVRLI